MYLNSTLNSFDNFFQLIMSVILLLVIMVVAYFVTRWIGNMGNAQLNNKNIKVIEGRRVGQNKFVEIVKVGSKYFVLGIGKDEISCLGEVKEEELVISEDTMKPLPDFNQILAKMKEKTFPTKKNNK
ncbi:MAG: flagellar biosynthetic protein FliO [Lachnospiraceae bacterium]|nr:flagellar biosynthetic protein FliO [Lachnospiraceae bacterium]